MYNHLFSGIKIRGLELKNRVVFPAMGSRYCTDDGYAFEQLADYHAARSAGGCGLNVVEATAVYKPGAVYRMLQISDDSYIPGLKKVADAIREAGGKSCLQLWQAGLAAVQTPGAAVVMPSDLPMGPDFVIPGASIEVIHECVKAFGDGARRAVEAGFDCVEFHAAHNYSPHAFLSPAFNHRTDEYGGTPENRARYLLECIQAIRANIPEDMPLLMRITAQDDELPGGLTIDDVVQFCKWAKEAGVDVLNVSRGNLVTSAMRFEVPPLDIPKGFNVDNASYIRRETGMPTIAVGRINDPDQAEEILASDKADMVVIGRAQICDPDFCNKTQEGRVDDIVRCVGCNQGCHENCMVALPISCLRNPSVGREAEFKSIKAAETSKKVLVIGGGMGGMEAAITAKRLGHDVTLAEASNKLGGQFFLAGQAPRKEEMAEAAISRGEQIIREGVKVELNTKVDAEYLDVFKPEAIICAIGASPIVLPVPKDDEANICNAVDVLSGKCNLTGNVIVIGGGLVGLEVAEYIREKGNDVTVVEMMDEIGKDVCVGRKADIMMNVLGSGIKPVTNAKCMAIKKDAITVEINGEQSDLPGETFVIAVGSSSNNHEWLAKWCESHDVEYKVIGDAVKARRALNAIHEGVQAARDIS